LSLRNITLLNVALDTLFRASNLVSIRLDDVDLANKTIKARKSKTDKEGYGHYGYISDDTIALLKQWTEQANITDGLLFRTLTPKKHQVKDTGLSLRMLWQIYRDIETNPAGTLRRFSCHSTRIGAVITMVERQVPLAQIIQSGAWKNEAMAIRYSKQYNAATTGMAGVR